MHQINQLSKLDPRRNNSYHKLKFKPIHVLVHFNDIHYMNTYNPWILPIIVTYMFYSIAVIISFAYYSHSHNRCSYICVKITFILYGLLALFVLYILKKNTNNNLSNFSLNGFYGNNMLHCVDFASHKNPIIISIFIIIYVYVTHHIFVCLRAFAAKFCGGEYLSNPFGILCNHVLCNTIHHGILSTNLSLNNNYIWLSDMKFLPGMEGGIIISSNINNINQFIGIISIPLMIGNNASLTTIIPSHIILSWLLHKNTFNSNITSDSSTLFRNTHYLSSLNTVNGNMNTCSEIYNAMQSVLPICIGSHWGSCILISNDHILTNAHIIRPYLKDINEKDYVKRIELKNTSRYDSPKIGMQIGNNRKWLQCKLIYITHNDSPWDLAWLRCIEYKNEYKSFMKPIKLKYVKNKSDINMEYKHIFNERNNVFVIGYGLIHPSRGLLPLISSGILSQIVYNNSNQNDVIILKTSADIHAGHSGGLLCDQNGYMLGLLTNNSVFDFDTNKSAMNTWEKEKLWNKNGIEKRKYNLVWNKGNISKNVENKKISFVYPNLNSVLPFSVIYKLYKCIMDGSNGINVDERLKKVFEELDKPNTVIQAKWKKL